MSETAVPEQLKTLYDYLGKMNDWVDEIKPIDQPMRFGNKSFRTWYDKVKETLNDELNLILTEEAQQRGIVELTPYFLDAFGSYERIDYGTGHEMNFFIFLYCLFRMGVFGKDCLIGMVNKVFQRYLVLMRRLQTIYMLEPAGSHGVWGLDDYQHLAFILGAG
jgi:serine/threonine-protein phosphatase 2A activator